MKPSQQQLNQLTDIILPAAPGFWPPAPGFIALGLLALLLIVCLYVFLTKKRHAPWWLEVSCKIKTLEKRTHATREATEQAAVIAQVNQLLKQVALTCYCRKKIAALEGDDWLKFLDQTLLGQKPSNKQAFSFYNGAGKILNSAYAQHLNQENAPEFNRSVFFEICHTWIRLQSYAYPKYKNQGP